MTANDFNTLLDRRLELTRQILATKSAEYSPGDDKLHNFKKAAKMLGGTPAQACLGFMAKHWVSIIDLVEAHRGNNMVRLQQLDEKIGDAINYLILLEACLVETK